MCTASPAHSNITVHLCITCPAHPTTKGGRWWCEDGRRGDTYCLVILNHGDRSLPRLKLEGWVVVPVDIVDAVRPVVVPVGATSSIAVLYTGIVLLLRFLPLSIFHLNKFSSLGTDKI